MIGAEKDIYLKIAESTGVFKPQELEVLKEVLTECQKRPEGDYFLLDDTDDDKVRGFVIFGRAPLTEFCWDIYWLAVDRGYQSKGVGRRLLRYVEEVVAGKQDYAVLRVETSTRKEYAHARNLYVKEGFKEAGRIPNFYSFDDDLVVFYKECGRVY
jgi:ribosomal protein S18 acetylase RimI-like enzyme